jgi:hypothetical protein
VGGGKNKEQEEGEGCGEYCLRIEEWDTTGYGYADGKV